MPCNADPLEIFFKAFHLPVQGYYVQWVWHGLSSSIKYLKIKPYQMWMWRSSVKNNVMTKIWFSDTTFYPKTLPGICIQTRSLVALDSPLQINRQPQRESRNRITCLNRKTQLYGFSQRLFNKRKPAGLLRHNLETRHGSLTCSWASHVLWALAWRPWLLGSDNSLSEHHCSFFQHIHTGPLCQATDMVKGTTAVFIVSVVVPVAFVPQCLHAAIRPQQMHSSLAQLSKCTWFLFPRLRGRPVKTDSCPGICLVFSIHLIVVTQGPLVLECLLQITHIIPTGSEIIHW